jgi:hypothetical protein
MSAPLTLGAAPLPVRLAPQGATTDVIRINIIDQFLRDAGRTRKQSTRKSSSGKNQSTRPTQGAQNQSRAAIPAAPALAIVPLPLAKPGEDAAPEATAPAAATATPEVAAKPVDAKPETAPETTAEKPAERPAEPPVPAPDQTQSPEQTGKAPEETIPTPTPKPEEPAEQKPAASSDDGQADPGKTEPAKPDAAKPDTAKPDDKAPQDKAADDKTPADKPADEKQEQAETPPPPPLVEEDAAELKACLADLGAIGAKFESVKPIDDGNGCGIKQPIEVAEVLPGVDLGGATMRCKTALTMAHWLKDTVQPALNIAMPGRKITGLVPGSTYQCRLRNSASTGKISEHGRGNAFDVAAFKLDNGEKVVMKRRDDDHTLEGAFQKTAAAGACLHFTTVLAPGSDAAHEDHLHLDIIERDGGYRICE